MTATTIHIPTLHSARLTLRAHRRADMEAFAQTLASDRARHMVDNPSRGHAWATFVNDVASWCLNDFGIWAVDLHNGTHIGQTGFNRPEYFPEPELGWLLHGGYEGAGYATEAAQTALAWYWANTDEDSVVSYITPQNASSIALAERLGAAHDPDAPLPDGETPEETVVYRHRRPLQ